MTGDINKITDEDVQDFKTLVTSPQYVDSFNEYQRLATKTAIYPGVGTPLGLMYVTIKSGGEVGEFSEKVGKAMRDEGLGNGLYYDGGAVQEGGIGLSDVRRGELILELGDELWYLSAKCNELGVTLSEVALLNLQKLNGRTKRGTLGGSGDSR